MSMDPTDIGGQLPTEDHSIDLKSSYTTHTSARWLNRPNKPLNESNRFAKDIVVPITQFDVFYPAEDYHQDYYKTNPSHYKSYRRGSGREDFLRKTWGDELNTAIQTSPEQFLQALASRSQEHPEQPAIQCHSGRRNRTSLFKRVLEQQASGIYVDIVSGEPLFSSNEKFASGTGWPSFFQPLVSENIVEKTDRSHSMTRVEVRSAKEITHLGHLFPDGPKPTGLRYYHSASLKFIAAEDLEQEGYGQFAALFQ